MSITDKDLIKLTEKANKLYEELSAEITQPGFDPQDQLDEVEAFTNQLVKFTAKIILKNYAHNYLDLKKFLEDFIIFTRLTEQQVFEAGIDITNIKLLQNWLLETVILLNKKTEGGINGFQIPKVPDFESIVGTKPGGGQIPPGGTGKTPGESMNA